MSPSEPIVTSREEARKLGLKFYKPEKPCISGHYDLRYVANSGCVSCRRNSRAKSDQYGPRCSVDGCNKKRDSKGYCPAHYQRWKKHGDPLAGGTQNGDGLKWLADHVDYQSDNCLIWPFRREPDEDGGPKGRGITYIDGQVVGAHVAMCRLAHGEKPPEKDVAAHSCGRGIDSCVNPRHLRWATYAENEADKHLHGTAIVGSKSHFAKLTEDDVRRIRTLQNIVSQKSLAKMFGVDRHTIARIHNRISWFNLD